MEEQSDWLAHATFMDALMDAGFILLVGHLADGHRVSLRESAGGDALEDDAGTDEVGAAAGSR
jgi:hypothetical protein